MVTIVHTVQYCPCRDKVWAKGTSSAARSRHLSNLRSLNISPTLHAAAWNPATTHLDLPHCTQRLHHVWVSKQLATYARDLANANTISTYGSSNMALSPPQTVASADSNFTDSAIMDMTTTTLLSQSKPQFESGQFESGLNTPLDYPADEISERLGTSVQLTAPSDEFQLSDQAIKAVRTLPSPVNKTDSEELSPPSDTDTESDIQVDPELVSHLTTTVSSLRLRHREQAHLQSLFTSKLEALAQKSLAQEAAIRSLTAELQSVRESNAQLGCENALLAHENNELRVSMQNLQGEVVERERAVEAMTGAVRGLEGWIESANNSPRSSSNGHLLRNNARHGRTGTGNIRGKGRFRGRYDHDGDESGGLGLDGTADVDTVEIQEGVMAWVRGFKDVEEGLKEGRQGDGKGTQVTGVNGLPPTDLTNNTADTFSEDFGEFVAGR